MKTRNASHLTNGQAQNPGGGEDCPESCPDGCPTHGHDDE